jgi:hypothetical protein
VGRSRGTLVATAYAAVALASTAFGASKVVSHLTHERHRYAGFSEAQAERAIWEESPLRPAVFAFYRAHLRPGERYWVQARPAGPQSLVRPLLVRSYAAYWLLPAVQVRRLADADAVVSYRADPRSLGVPLASVVRSGVGAVARIRR